MYIVWQFFLNSYRWALHVVRDCIVGSRSSRLKFNFFPGSLQLNFLKNIEQLSILIKSRLNNPDSKQLKLFRIALGRQVSSFKRLLRWFPVGFACSWHITNFSLFPGQFLRLIFCCLHPLINPKMYQAIIRGIIISGIICWVIRYLIH